MPAFIAAFVGGGLGKQIAYSIMCYSAKLCNGLIH